VEGSNSNHCTFTAKLLIDLRVNSRLYKRI
jgi:hypothetical protein